jgi:hypothetical protein
LHRRSVSCAAGDGDHVLGVDMEAPVESATPLQPRRVTLPGMPSHELTIDPGFAGMPGVAHGGYVAGLLTVALGASGTRARLRRPVPTGRALQIEHAAGAQIELRNRERLLAEGAAADVLVRVPDAVSAREAEAATQRFADLAHPFPMCVCCGPDHAGGLHVFPGPVAGRGVVAAHWVPSERLAGADGRLPRELVRGARLRAAVGTDAPLAARDVGSQRGP